MLESVWTPSSDWCQRPEHWNSDTADATEHEVTGLVAAFARALQPDLVIETGSNTGQTAHALGVALQQNGHGKVVTLDIDPEMVRATQERCAGLPVEVVQQPGWEYVPDRPVGMLWLDSDAHQRHLELVHFRPFLLPGAVIGVHDTAPHHPVHDHLKPVLHQLGATGLRLRTPRGVSFYQCS